MQNSGRSAALVRGTTRRFSLKVWHRGAASDEYGASAQQPRTDAKRWARNSTGFIELKGQHEIQALILILQKLSEDQLEQAAGMIVQKPKSLLVAKSATGSWETCATIDLSTTCAGVIPQAEIALSGRGLA